MHERRQHPFVILLQGRIDGSGIQYFPDLPADLLCAWAETKLASADMHICFGIFLYNLEIRGVDPVVACEKIKLATDQRFSCYDREEESISLHNYSEMHYGYEYD